MEPAAVRANRPARVGHRSDQVENAVIEVTSGQGQGQRLVQTTPCDAWSYSDGFEFKDLTPGMSMTLRASAPGWTTAEKTVIPTAGGGPPLLIELHKL